MSKLQRVGFMVLMTITCVGIYYFTHFVLLRYGSPESQIYRDVQVWSITPAVISWIISLVIALSSKVANFFFFTKEGNNDR